MENSWNAADDVQSGKHPLRNILAVSASLCFVAGYCDTATFITDHHLLSSHIAANLVFFALDLHWQNYMQACLKLISFPVFITGLAGGRYLLARFTKTYLLFLSEGIVLTLAAVMFFRFHNEHTPAGTWLAMLIVFAMGMQSAMLSFPAKKGTGDSPVMSAVVLKVALTPLILLPGQRLAGTAARLYRGAAMIAGYVMGCVVSASVSTHKGLSGIILPAIVILSVCYYDWQAQRLSGPA